MIRFKIIVIKRVPNMLIMMMMIMNKIMRMIKLIKIKMK
jgi:hypothetical protein